CRTSTARRASDAGPPRGLVPGADGTGVVVGGDVVTMARPSPIGAAASSAPGRHRGHSPRSTPGRARAHRRRPAPVAPPHLRVSARHGPRGEGGSVRGEVRKGAGVTWSAHGGTGEGEGIEKITSDTEAAGRTVRASADDPQYRVRSDNSGGEA